MQHIAYLGFVSFFNCFRRM